MYVFFDLDGTLTDPKEGIVACIQFALSSLNIEIDEDVKLETFIGPPLRDTFRQLCENEILAEKAVNLYRERFSNTGLYENRLYDGIEECLESLIGKVRSNYVVTSKPTGFSERIVEHFNISEHFEVVYGSNLDGSLGDKTELLAHVLNSEGINPESLGQKIMESDLSVFYGDMDQNKNYEKPVQKAYVKIHCNCMITYSHNKGMQSDTLLLAPLAAMRR
jgi:phosphoglycolate phosphatase